MASEETRAIEAIVMVSDQPVDPNLLSQLLEISAQRVEELCAELAESYRRDERGFELVRVAGGYRFQSHADMAPYVERYVLEGQSARMSAAALETLAIVAYKQPVSRAQVAAIRGVNADAVIRTLQTRGFICEVGRDPGPGQATLYGTTTLLLERLGLDTINQLPPLAQFVPGPEIMDALERSLRADRPSPAANEPSDEAEPSEQAEAPESRWEPGPASEDRAEEEPGDQPGDGEDPDDEGGPDDAGGPDDGGRPDDGGGPDGEPVPPGGSEVQGSGTADADPDPRW